MPSQDRFLKENISREDLMDMFEDALLMLYTFRREDESVEEFVNCCKEDGFSIGSVKSVPPRTDDYLDHYDGDQ
jgi:hypothetical protein